MGKGTRVKFDFLSHVMLHYQSLTQILVFFKAAMYL
jgi:hypothetical protein